jgi:hypothetical protein
MDNTREKLIELEREATDHASDICIDHRDCEDCPGRKYGTHCRDYLKADHLIAHGVTVQKWIPVSEPPKKITNKVIVLCKNGYRGFGHYEDYKGKQTWYNLENDRPFTDWDLEDCESYEVTHWMPRPEAPKGE